MVLTNWGVIFETEHRKAIWKVIYYVVDLIICIAKYIQFFAMCMCVCIACFIWVLYNFPFNMRLFWLQSFLLFYMNSVPCGFDVMVTKVFNSDFYILQSL